MIDLYQLFSPVIAKIYPDVDSHHCDAALSLTLALDWLKI